MTTTALTLPTSNSRTQSAVESLLFTAAGLGTLFLLGKAIALSTAGMPYGCWQSTGARAGASALVVGSLVAMRRGNLALFGAGYALILLASHWSPLLLASAASAGAAAFGIDRLLNQKTSIVRVLAATLTFNLLLTLSAFIKSLSSTNGRTGLNEFTNATVLRVASTVVIGLAIVVVSKLIAGRRASER